MNCQLCGNKFYIKRSILTLFKSQKEYICNNCLKKYEIKIEFETIYLDIYSATIVTFFKSKYKIDYNAYVKEYSKIFETLYKKAKAYPIFLDHIILNDYTIETLDIISKLNNKDIIIFCFSKKNY